MNIFYKTLLSIDWFFILYCIMLVKYIYMYSEISNHPNKFNFLHCIAICYMKQIKFKSYTCDIILSSIVLNHKKFMKHIIFLGSFF
jgi:hypothetical protein